MSYPVRVVVKETVRDRVETQDEFKLTLSDDPVLRKPGARQQLRELLEQGGWQREEEGGERYRKELDGGVNVTWDLDANELTLTAGAGRDVEFEAQRELRGDSMTREGASQQEEELKASGRKILQRQLESQLEEAREDVQKDMLDDIHDRLEAAHETAMQEVNEMLETVYRDWLVEQAKSLGNVVSQHESESDNGEVYELTIRIEA